MPFSLELLEFCGQTLLLLLRVAAIAILSSPIPVKLFIGICLSNETSSLANNVNTFGIMEVRCACVLG